MRKLLLLWLVGTASVVANISAASPGGPPAYEDANPARTKLAELRAILDAENSDDFDDDVIDPDDEGDIQDDEEDQEGSSQGGPIPT